MSENSAGIVISVFAIVMFDCPEVLIGTPGVGGGATPIWSPRVFAFAQCDVAGKPFFFQVG